MITRRHFMTAAAACLVSMGLHMPLHAQESPVRIGYSISKTGPFAAAAQEQLAVYQMWKDEVNAKGGMNVAGTKRPIELVEYDNQSKPEQSIRIYEKLITDDKVDLLLAPWGTPFQIALAPVLEKYKFPVVGNTGASVAVRQVKPGYIWFPTSAIPDRMAVELTAMLKENGVKTAAIISNILPFTKEIKNFTEPALEKAGIKVVYSTEYPPSIKDMTSMVTQIRDAKPDAVLVLSYPADSVLYQKQANEIGIKSPFQFVAVGPSTSAFRDATGQASEGVVTIGHWSPEHAEWPNARAFRDNFVKRYKHEPDYLNAALTYLSLEILEQAVAKAGLDKEKLRETISNDTFSTINGDIRFEGVENVITPTAFLQIQDGKLQIVWPDSIATSKFRPKSGG